MRSHAVWLLLLLLGGCAEFQKGPVATGRPDSEFVAVGGRRIHLLDSGGSGPAILFIHGFGAWGRSWKPILDRLPPAYRMIAPDLPGFGLSDRYPGDYSPGALADDLAALLEERGVARAVVVGQSWGSSVAMAFALRHPQQTERLVLISPYVYSEQIPTVFEWMARPLVGEALVALFWDQLVGERMELLYADPSLVSQAAVDLAESILDRPGAKAAILAAARGMQQIAEQEHLYGGIGVETLVLLGRQDHVTTVPFAESIVRHLPRARLFVIGGCGHVVQVECLGPTVTALAEFLR
jgi:pimeloyl-ACP methyl ester carboxylesterase